MRCFVHGSDSAMKGLLVVVFALWARSALAQKCPEVLEDFSMGFFEVFSGRCTGSAIFDVIKYDHISDIVKPENSSDFLATGTGGQRCFNNPTLIQVVPGTEAIISMIKTSGEVLCIVKITGQSGNVILSDKQIPVNQDIWTKYSYMFEASDNITIELKCDFIDRPRLGISYISVGKPCSTITTPQTTPPDSTTLMTTPTTTFMTTTIMTTTSTEVESTTLTSTTPTEECRPITEDFTNGTYLHFSRRCRQGQPFVLRRYSENDDIGPPDIPTNDYFATTVSQYNCIRSDEYVVVTPGSKIEVAIYTYDTPVLCLVAFLDRSNSEIVISSLSDINTTGWGVASVNVTIEKEVTIEFSCDVFDQMIIAVDYIELKDRC